MGQMKRLYVILCAILVLALPVSAVNSISAEIISPASAAPGDIISFEILVTNLAPVFLDHCNYIFSVGPYVDLI